MKDHTHIFYKIHRPGGRWGTPRAREIPEDRRGTDRNGQNGHTLKIRREIVTFYIYPATRARKAITAAPLLYSSPNPVPDRHSSATNHGSLPLSSPSRRGFGCSKGKAEHQKDEGGPLFPERDWRRRGQAKGYSPTVSLRVAVFCFFTEFLYGLWSEVCLRFRHGLRSLYGLQFPAVSFLSFSLPLFLRFLLSVPSCFF